MSPIRPENRALYPDDWAAIVARVRKRAGDSCECRGECGSEHTSANRVCRGLSVRIYYSPRCHIPNGVWIARDPKDGAHWERAYPENDPDYMRMDPWEDVAKAVRCVLTVAHLDHDPTNNAMSNLRAMCQRCHNRYDREHRNETAKRTRLAKRTAGIVSLPLPEGDAHE